MSNWKYRINIKKFLTSEQNLTEQEYRAIGKAIAKKIYVFMEDTRKTEGGQWFLDDLEEIYNSFLTSSSEEDINETLEYLYDVADCNSIWIG